MTGLRILPAAQPWGGGPPRSGGGGAATLRDWPLRQRFALPPPHACGPGRILWQLTAVSRLPARIYFAAPQVTGPLPTLRTVQTGRPSTTTLPIPRDVIAALLTARRI